VVVSFTPQVFLSKGHDRFDKAYQGNFSPLQANQLAFSNDLSPSLERDIATALLSHAITLRDEPLLNMALRARASGTPWGRVRYAMLYPLGRLEGVLYRLADDFQVWKFLRGQPPTETSPPRATASPDWTALADSADRFTLATSGNNPWGIEDQYYTRYGQYFLKQKGTKSPEVWLANLKQGYGWPELDLLLRLLQERGARPLIVTMPKHGIFDDYAGLPGTARRAYYERFSSAVAPYGFPLETFQRYDSTKFFLNDPDSHMSPKGWLVYDQLVDAYYHSTLR
jgi:D-alanine transfer protein